MQSAIKKAVHNVCLDTKYFLSNYCIIDFYLNLNFSNHSSKAYYLIFKL